MAAGVSPLRGAVLGLDGGGGGGGGGGGAGEGGLDVQYGQTARASPIPSPPQYDLAGGPLRTSTRPTLNRRTTVRV